MARTKRALSGKNTFSVGVDTSGLKSFLDELADEMQDAVRPAAQAGAQVLYERVQLNVSMIGRVTGNLSGSIYQAFSPENSGGSKAIYHVSWNHKKAPHGHLLEYGYLQRYRYRPDGMGPMVRPGMDNTKKPGRRATQAQKNAYYVTLPSPKQVPGRAFIRSAQSSMDAAYQAAEAEMLRRIESKAAK